MKSSCLARFLAKHPSAGDAALAAARALARLLEWPGAASPSIVFGGVALTSRYDMCHAERSLWQRGEQIMKLYELHTYDACTSVSLDDVASRRRWRDMRGVPCW